MAVLNKYFEALERLDLEGALRLLDDEFLYNETLDKKAMKAELEEDFEEIRRLTGKFRIVRDVKKLEMVDGQPMAEVELSFLLDGTSLSPSRVVQIGLIQREGNWLLKSWRDLSGAEGQ